MTYQGGEFSIESLFIELKRMADDEKIQTFAEYKGLVDALVEEKKMYGFLLDEEDTVQIRKTLELRWSELEAGLDHISKILT